MTLVNEIAWAAWDILLISLPYIILGFTLAGLLKVFLPDSLISKHLGSNGIGAVLKASAIGVPLPICSCGVVPAAAGIRKQGASKGATASFLISTPETGVDSIAITYGLLGPFFTVIRPIAAFVTAIITGVIINAIEREAEAPAQEPEMKSSSCGSSCGCQSAAPPESNVDKVKAGLHFAFVDLVKDTGGWFMLGIGIAALITVFISPEMVEAYFGNQFLSMGLMLAISIPLYVCATSSTPIAAAFLLKGISPGAVLIFLLAGPATNAASITVISRVIGKKATSVYLLVIIVVSVALGLMVDLASNMIWSG